MNKEYELGVKLAMVDAGLMEMEKIAADGMTPYMKRIQTAMESQGAPVGYIKRVPGEEDETFYSTWDVSPITKLEQKRRAAAPSYLKTIGSGLAGAGLGGLGGYFAGKALGDSDNAGTLGALIGAGVGGLGGGLGGYHLLDRPAAEKAQAIRDERLALQEKLQEQHTAGTIAAMLEREPARGPLLGGIGYSVGRGGRQNLPLTTTELNDDIEYLSDEDLRGYR